MTQQPSKRARPSPTIRVGVLGLFAAFLLVLPLALAPRAEAFIYWSAQPGAIGRANLDGTGVDESFIGDIRLSRAPRGRRRATSTGPHPNTSTIGRANLDGTGVDDSFITPSPGAAAERYRGRRRAHLLDRSLALAGIGDRPRQPRRHRRRPELHHRRPTARSDVAVDASHVYWAALRARPRSARRRHRPRQPRWHRRRASFIPVPVRIRRTALRSTPSHIYWLDLQAPRPSAAPTSTAPRSIRASSTTSDPPSGDVAVDAEHIYWSTVHAAY